jgi:hypothetical protein
MRQLWGACDTAMEQTIEVQKSFDIQRNDEAGRLTTYFSCNHRYLSIVLQPLISNYLFKILDSYVFGCKH